MSDNREIPSGEISSAVLGAQKDQPIFAETDTQVAQTDNAIADNIARSRNPEAPEESIEALAGGHSAASPQTEGHITEEPTKPEALQGEEELDADAPPPYAEEGTGNKTPEEEKTGAAAGKIEAAVAELVERLVRAPTVKAVKEAVEKAVRAAAGKIEAAVAEGVKEAEAAVAEGVKEAEEAVKAEAVEKAEVKAKKAALAAIVEELAKAKAGKTSDATTQTEESTTVQQPTEDAKEETLQQKETKYENYIDKAVETEPPPSSYTETIKSPSSASLPGDSTITPDLSLK